jgi:hypothetical protein
MRFSKPNRKGISLLRRSLFRFPVPERTDVFQRSIADVLNHKLKGRFGSYWISGLLLLLLVFTAYCIYLLARILINLFNPF